MLYFVFFFFKQKTAYEMRISDWSSDVCSSDLLLTPTLEPSSDGLMISGRPKRSAAVIRSASRSIHSHSGVGSPSAFQMRLVRSLSIANADAKIGRASCRERVCQYV